MSTCQRARRDGRDCTQPSGTGDCGRHGPPAAPAAPAGAVVAATVTTDPFGPPPSDTVSRDDLAASLAARITADGGSVTVDVLDDDFERIAADGGFMDGRPVRFMPGAASQCHRNTAALHDAGIARIATGYAQSDNGGWVQHSWGVDVDDGTIIETTVPRARYFGIVLTDDEAAEFVFFNA